MLAVDSSVEGPSAEGVPGQRIRTKLEYPGEGGGTFDAEGYLAVDERERKMEWGAEEGRDYSGWLTVADRGEGGSEVVVHLSFGERSAGPEIEERSPEGRDPLAEGISATLESIRRQVEEGSGKLEAPPSPGGRRTSARGEPGGGRRGPFAGPAAVLTLKVDNRASTVKKQRAWSKG
jgi:hypothetical protein